MDYRCMIEGPRDVVKILRSLVIHEEAEGCVVYLAGFAISEVTPRDCAEYLKTKVTTALISVASS